MNKKVKVLFLSTLPPPYHGASMSSVMCLNILKSDPSFDVKNIQLNHSKEVSDLGKVTIKKLFGIYTIYKKIKYLIKSFKPDVIYFAPAVTGFALYRDFFFIKVIKHFYSGYILLHIRGQFKEEEWNHFITKQVIKGILNGNKAIVLGPELVNNLREEIPLKDIFILPNALDKTLSDQEFQSIYQKRFLNNKYKLLFLSNMVEFKGWFKVLQTCKLLLDTDRDFVCDFVGDWPSDLERKKFYVYIEENNLTNNVFHHGQLLSKEKNKKLEEADLLILPTEYDACPRVVIEAMEFGLPVISSNVGAIPSLINHENTGYIVQKNIPSEILVYVLELKSINLRKIMGLQARERFIEKFTLDTYKSQFRSILNP